MRTKTFISTNLLLLSGLFICSCFGFFVCVRAQSLRYHPIHLHYMDWLWDVVELFGLFSLFLSTHLTRTYMQVSRSFIVNGIRQKVHHARNDISYKWNKMKWRRRMREHKEHPAPATCTPMKQKIESNAVSIEQYSLKHLYNWILHLGKLLL